MGSDVSYDMQTADLIPDPPEQKIRTDSVKFRVKGNSILVQYSTNKGASWTTLDTVDAGVEFSRIELPHQVVTNRIRYRLVGTGSGFSAEWMTLKYRYETGY